MRVYLLPATLLMAFAGQAVAQDQGPAPAKKEKKICRSEKVTGSRTKVNTICMTAAEWEELSQKTRDGMDRMSRDAGQPVHKDPASMGGF